ncbi:hypothetical protein BG004_001413 [Podila humilis]|nr:hypothetical protein BG004_001413 [Podila humilis]
MELCKKGVLTEVSLAADKAGVIFSDDECRDVFQQMVLGIEYLHEHDIIHRDIKPDNLLRSEDGTLKIVDFGVSEMFKKGNDRTKKSAGSPAFMAPELCRHDHGEVSGRATDVWSMGVTLYCIRYGRLPFISSNILELNRVIREDAFDLSTEKDERFVHLMSCLLEKDPAKRISIEELRNDPWLTADGNEPLISKEENTQNAVTEVTEEDLRGAIQKINNLVAVLKAASKFKKLIKSPGSTASSFNDDMTVADKMQDADETIPVSTMSSPVSSTITTATPAPASVPGAPTATFSSDSRMSAAQDESFVEMALDVKEMSVKSDELFVKVEQLAIASASDEDKQESSTSTQLETNSQEGHQQASASSTMEPIEYLHGQGEGAMEGEGYSYCDMITGTCYWVPTKKAEGDNKLSSSQEEEEESSAFEDIKSDVTPAEVVDLGSSSSSFSETNKVSISISNSSSNSNSISNSSHSRTTSSSASYSPAATKPLAKNAAAAAAAATATTTTTTTTAAKSLASTAAPIDETKDSRVGKSSQKPAWRY